MLTLPNQGVIVVATPRTGSRAMEAGIMQAAKGRDPCVQSKIHHPWPHDVESGNKHKYEIWSIIREPHDQLKSWIGHCSIQPDEITWWLDDYKARYFMYEGGINIYNRIVDRYFIYGNNAHRQMLDALGYEDEEVEFPKIGGTRRTQFEFTPEQTEYIAQRFTLDLELYELWFNKIG